MKRHRNLFDRVVTFENLLRSFKRAYRGCSKSLEAKVFDFHLEPELLALKAELESGTYRPGGFRTFRIHDPKERTISVAPFRDRVVHHAVVGVLEPIYERVFIHDSYATRKGKGTHKAIARVQRFLHTHRWYARADIRHFFETVNHDVLLSIVTRKIKDPQVMELLDVIIRAVPTPTGLPIGNLTSQFFANVYLDPLDHHLKDHLGVKRYVRYMDDLVFLSNDPEELKGWLKQVEGFVRDRLRLELKAKAVYINRRENGIGFLGARIFPKHLRVKRTNLKRCLDRFQGRVMEFGDGKITEDEFTASQTSVLGHLDIYNTHHLKKSLGQATSFWR